MIFNNYFVTPSLYYIYPIPTPHPLLCQFYIVFLLSMSYYEPFFFLRGMKNFFFFFSFRNFGISLIKMTPVTQPGIRA